MDRTAGDPVERFIRGLAATAGAAVAMAWAPFAYALPGTVLVDAGYNGYAREDGGFCPGVPLTGFAELRRQCHAYWLFDLPATGHHEILRLTLQLSLREYRGADPAELFLIRDASALTFEALDAGTPLGWRIATPDEAGGMIELELASDTWPREGGLWLLAATLPSADPSATDPQSLSFGNRSQPGRATLVVELREPSWLAPGLALLAVATWLRPRKDSSSRQRALRLR